MRVFSVMLGFNTSEMIRGAMNNFADTGSSENHIVKWFFDAKFPGNNPTDLKNLCAHFGWIYTPIENEGVLGNWNKVIHDHLHMVNGDFLVTFDPDVRMNKPGWIDAMIEALNSDPKAMFCSSALPFHHEEWMTREHGRVVTELPSGLRIARYRGLIAWASGMWRADALITRDRNFGARGRYYGWNEHADYERLLANGWTWLSTADYVDHHLGSSDAKYVEWKQKTAAGQISTKFEEWLNG